MNVSGEREGEVGREQEVKINRERGWTRSGGCWPILNEPLDDKVYGRGKERQGGGWGRGRGWSVLEKPCI